MSECGRGQECQRTSSRPIWSFWRPALLPGCLRLFPKKSASALRARRIEIRGVVTSGGQDVTIVANQIAFIEPDGLIDTSGIDALNKRAPGNEPRSPDAPGTDGVAGEAAPDDSDAGQLVIATLQITGAVRIRAAGVGKTVVTQRLTGCFY